MDQCVYTHSESNQKIIVTRETVNQAVSGPGEAPGIPKSWGYRDYHLRRAVDARDLELIRCLESLGANRHYNNSEFAFQLTFQDLSLPGHWKKYQKENDILKYYLETGGDPNQSNQQYGGSLLWRFYHNFEALFILLEQGADPFKDVIIGDWNSENFVESFATASLDTTEIMYRMALHGHLVAPTPADLETMLSKYRRATDLQIHKPFGRGLVTLWGLRVTVGEILKSNGIQEPERFEDLYRVDFTDLDGGFWMELDEWDSSHDPKLPPYPQYGAVNWTVNQL